jgi:hypothetical protein
VADPGRASFVEEFARRAEGFLLRHTTALLVGFTAVYFCGTALRALGRPFWFDEILTLAAARQPGFAETVRAARVFDAMPPLVHVVQHAIHATLGTNELTARLPGMIGFWVLALCLFRFVSRRAGALYGVAAMLLPFSTGSYGYSFEARSYGMLLGFAGLALAGWQEAAGGPWRRLGLAALALGVAGATATHYYGVLLYLPLAGAEALRALGRRRPDWPVWAALAAGIIPMAAALNTIRAVARANAHPWSRASAGDYLEYYETQFQHAIPFAAALLGLLALVWLLELGRSAPPVERRPPPFPAHEMAVAALLFAIPLAAITLALAVPPHQFTGRYVVTAIAGFALLVPLLAAGLLPGRSAVAAAMAAAALLPFLGELAQARRLVNPIAREPLLAVALASGPVVVDDGVLFLQIWRYAPAGWRPRLLFLGDTDAAVRYTGADTVDLNLLSAAPLFDLPVVRYADFARPGREFTLYLTGTGWLPRRVVADGGSLEIIRMEGGRALARARIR